MTLIIFILRVKGLRPRQIKELAMGSLAELSYDPEHIELINSK